MLEIGGRWWVDRFWFVFSVLIIWKSSAVTCSCKGEQTRGKPLIAAPITRQWDQPRSRRLSSCMFLKEWVTWWALTFCLFSLTLLLINYNNLKQARCTQLPSAVACTAVASWSPASYFSPLSPWWSPITTCSWPTAKHRTRSMRRWARCTSRWGCNWSASPPALSRLWSGRAKKEKKSSGKENLMCRMRRVAESTFSDCKKLLRIG